MPLCMQEVGWVQVQITVYIRLDQAQWLAEQANQSATVREALDLLRKENARKEEEGK